MLALELVVALGVIVLLVSTVGARTRIAPPILLLSAGALVGFIPALQVSLNPDVVLLLFLPALLYWESLNTSLREIRANLRGIVLISTVLVVLSAAAVALVLHLLGLPWGPAWVVGAAVAPTDATATNAFVSGLPRRTTTTLQAESLINDGTTLVVYGLAVAATQAGEPPTGWQIGGTFAVSYLGGIAVGLATAALARLVRRRLDSALHENVATLLTPFIAYLIAELIGASGVLAVVICGLVMSQAGPKIGRADTRQQTRAFWTLSVFLLNGALFVLVGIQLHPAVRDLSRVPLPVAIGWVFLTVAVLIVVRTVFLYATAYLFRAVDRTPRQQGRRIPNRVRLVLAVAGFRGAVSLAAALAVPMTVASGARFPDRDLIIFVTAGVIAVTLIGQGLLLPLVVRHAHLPSDDAVDRELQDADLKAAEGALAALPSLAARDTDADAEVVERLTREYRARVEVRQEEADEAGRDRHRAYLRLRIELVRRMRGTVVELRDRHEIDDTVQRELSSQLDSEEVSLQTQLPEAPSRHR